MNLISSLIIPIAHAQTIGGVASNITRALNLVIPILFLVASIVFLAGVIMYITAGGAEDKIQKGKKYIIWGLIGLFVMVAVWGLVRLIISFVFGGTFLPSRAPQIPDIPGAGGSLPTSPFPTRPSPNGGPPGGTNGGGGIELPSTPDSGGIEI